MSDKIHRHGIQRGRPAFKMRDAHRLSVRLDSEAKAALDRYCRHRSINYSDAINDLLKTNARPLVGGVAGRR